MLRVRGQLVARDRRDPSFIQREVDVVEGGSNRVAIAQIAVNKFCVLVYPCWFPAAMRLRLQIIKRADTPAFTYKKIDYM